MLQVIRKLIFKLVTPNRHSSRPVSKRVASLNHKLRNNTMEQDTFVIPAPCMSNKILHRFRRLLRKQAEVHVTESGVDGGGVGDR